MISTMTAMEGADLPWWRKVTGRNKQIALKAIEEAWQMMDDMMEEVKQQGAKHGTTTTEQPS